MERRQFLKGCSVAVAAAATESPRALLHLTDGAPAMNTAGGRSAFEPLIGSEFRAYDAAGRFVDRLRLITLETSPYCCEQVEQFTLVWESRAAAPLVEDIYELTDREHASLHVHIAPDAGRHYRSTFALLREQAG